MRRADSNRSPTRSARKCYPCPRNELLPICPEWTLKNGRLDGTCTRDLWIDSAEATATPSDVRRHDVNFGALTVTCCRLLSTGQPGKYPESSRPWNFADDAKSCVGAAVPPGSTNRVPSPSSLRHRA